MNLEKSARRWIKMVKYRVIIQTKDLDLVQLMRLGIELHRELETMLNKKRMGLGDFIDFWRIEKVEDEK